MISFRDVTKTYGTNIDVSRRRAMLDILIPLRRQRPELRTHEAAAVRGLSFDVCAGETFVILGPKGSGKRTVARLICGLTYPTVGAVEVSGKTRLVTGKHGGATPVMRLGEYARLLAMMLGEDSKSVTSTVDILIRDCHLEDWRNVRIHNVPAGALRRLGYYASLLIDADIYIFEANPGLRGEDEAFQEQVDARIQERLDTSTAVLLMERYPPNIAPDRGLVLHRGSSIYEGNPELAAASYAALAQRVEEVSGVPTEGEVAVTTFLSSLAQDQDDAAERISWDLKVSLDADKEIREIAASDKPIIAGPYLSSVDAELLLWIPFIRWVMRSLQVEEHRLTCVSRGGADFWYEGLSSNYVDALDHMSPDAFEQRYAKQISRTRLRQMGIEKLDSTIYDRSRRSLGIRKREDAEWLHPSLLFRLLMAAWRGTVKPTFLTDRLSVASFPRAPMEGVVPERPYVAVWFGATPYLQDSEPLKRLLGDVLRRLSGELVLVDVSSCEVLEAPFGEALFSPGSSAESEGRVKDREVFKRRTQIVAGADILVSSHGGLSYLAPMQGVHSVTVYEEPTHYLPIPTGYTAVNFHISRLLLEQLTGRVPMAIDATRTSAEELCDAVMRKMA